MEPAPGVAARCIRRPDCPGLFLYPSDSRVVCPATADLPFSWMFLLFGVFIVACGSTHAMEVWNLWHGMYWLAGAFKAITAAASVPTAILLAKLVPEALDLPSSAEWIKANASLQREIQERRDMEVILRISEANYREQAELLDLTHDAIFVRNLDGKIVYWNLGAERLYGWRKDEVRGKASHELLQTQFPGPVAEIMADVYQHGYWEGELIHRRRDGSEVIVSSRWALRKDSEGKPVSILESNRDITHRKRVDERFRTRESAPDAIVIVENRQDSVGERTDRKAFRLFARRAFGAASGIPGAGTPSPATCCRPSNLFDGAPSAGHGRWSGTFRPQEGRI